jgi:hypothetical protein
MRDWMATLLLLTPIGDNNVVLDGFCDDQFLIDHGSHLVAEAGRLGIQPVVHDKESDLQELRFQDRVIFHNRNTIQHLSTRSGMQSGDDHQHNQHTQKSLHRTHHSLLVRYGAGIGVAFADVYRMPSAQGADKFLIALPAQIHEQIFTHLSAHVLQRGDLTLPE